MYSPADPGNGLPALLTGSGVSADLHGHLVVESAPRREVEVDEGQVLSCEGVR